MNATTLSAVAEDSREVSGEVQSGSDQADQEKNPQQLITLAQGHFSGPLPPPSVLQGYEDVLPGAAERIVHMAEKEQSQRHTLDDSLAASVTRQQERGQWFAFMLGGGALALAAFMVHAGHPIYAIVTTVSSIATLAGALIYRRRSKPEEQSRGED